MANKSGHDDAGSIDSSQDFLRLVLDTNPNLIFVKDFDGRFVLANRATAEIYGTSVDNLVGKTDADFNSDIEQVRRFRDADQRVISTNEAKFIPEEPVTDARTGNVRWFQTHKVPLRATSGQVTQLLGVSTDITDRRRAETELVETQNQLLQSQKMETLGRFAGGIAHDFNNLLTIVMGSCDQLVDALSDDDNNLRSVNRITDATGRAVSLIRQLLAFSRKQVLQPRVVDLNKIVEEMKPFLVSLMDETIDIAISVDLSPAWVEVDPTQLQQVLMNLAGNAKDAMVGGGRLEIGVKNETGDSSAICRAGCVRLTVGDNGCGMDFQTKARIFDPFFTTKPTGKGTGLGLSTSYGIIVQSGGTMEVDSNLQKGTVFTITLPRSARCLEAAVSEELDPLAPKGNATILVVEDQHAVREVVCDLLRSLGYAVLEAQNATEAISIYSVEGQNIQLVLTDVVMPGMSGSVLAERLCSMSQKPKILFMSGYTEDSIVQNGNLKDGVLFIQKPFTAVELGRKVNAILLSSSSS